ncbi:TonB family protein [Chitinophagaceae bacterium MMS25-I14]
MFRYFFLFILSFVLSLKLLAQADTIYYDNSGNRVPDWTSCDYLRICEKLPDGRLKVDEYYSNNKPRFKGFVLSADSFLYHGYCIHYDKKGKKIAEGTYQRDRKEGDWKRYFDGTEIPSGEYYYSNDKFNGTQVEYYPSGKIKSKETYNNGHFLSESNYAQDGSEIKSSGKLEPPVFPGGDVQMKQYLFDEMDMPPPPRNKKWNGTVVIEFTITDEGKAVNPVIVKSLNDECDKEAIRLINAMPRWKPAMINGKPVFARNRIPVMFMNNVINVKYQ